MELHDIKQGSPEWLALRQNYFTGREATAMMDDSPYISRGQLLHQKKTGSTAEVTEHQQRQFDRGPAAEAGARPLLEKGMVGEDLFPVTGTRTVEGLPLLASFDGLTMDKSLVFEHKLWNEKLVAQIEGEGLEPTHYWQLEHQLLVSGAERVLFVSSDGTAENFRYVYYESQDHRRDALIAGWHQFKADLETFQPPTPEPVLVGELIPECMDLMAGIRGQVIQSNLAELESHIQQRIYQTKKELVSDQDFLDAESAVKFFSNTEKKLKDGKKNLLSQVPDIKKLFADIDHLAKAMANVRLPLDKKVKHWKQSRKDKMVLAVVAQLEQDRQAVNADLGVGWVPSVATAADFQEVLTNLRNPESMQSAINDRLAQARIDLKQQAAAMAKNLAGYQKLAAGKDYLFPDLDILLHKDQLDLMAIIEMRLNQESRQNEPANEPAPALEPAPEKEEDQQGQKQERTEWHRIVIFGKLAEIPQQFVKKGSKLYIEGKLQTRKWQDPNTGQNRYTTEIVVNGFGGVMNMLDGRQAGGLHQQQYHQPAQQQNQYANTHNGSQPAPQQQPQQAQYDQYDSSIPF